MNRRRVAVLVLLLWAVGLAALARRVWFQPSGTRLAIAAQQVAPGAAYWVVEREGHPVGFASSVLDTTLAGVRIVDMLVTGVRGAANNVTLRASTELTRSLVPLHYEASVRGGPLPLELRADMEGDTAVQLRVTSGDDGEATPQRVATRGPALSPSAVPLVFALGDQRHVDGRVALTVLDPLEMRVRDAVFRVTAESLFVVSDSAAFDTTARRWVSARRDTVRAWRLEPEDGAESSFAGWVDAAGRFVDASYVGGYRLRRTSYEEAALNWRRAGGDSAAAPVPGPARAGTP